MGISSDKRERLFLSFPRPFVKRIDLWSAVIHHRFPFSLSNDRKESREKSERKAAMNCRTPKAVNAVKLPLNCQSNRISSNVLFICFLESRDKFASSHSNRLILNESGNGSPNGKAMHDPLRERLIDRLRMLRADKLPHFDCWIEHLECGDSSPLSFLLLFFF
jgi:hypothetical protein